MIRVLRERATELGQSQAPWTIMLVPVAAVEAVALAVWSRLAAKHLTK
jgi:hypothetical protein